jgi:hypothetical protein
MVSDMAGVIANVLRDLLWAGWTAFRRWRSSILFQRDTGAVLGIQ